MGNLIRKLIVSIICFAALASTGLGQAQQRGSERATLIVEGKDPSGKPYPAKVAIQNLITGKVKTGESDLQGRIVFQGIETGYYFIGFKGSHQSEGKTRVGADLREIGSGETVAGFVSDGLPFQSEMDPLALLGQYGEHTRDQECSEPLHEIRVTNLERLQTYYKLVLERVRDVEAKVREKILSGIDVAVRAIFERELRGCRTATEKIRAVQNTYVKLQEKINEAARLNLPVKKEIFNDYNKLSRLNFIYQTEQTLERTESAVKGYLEAHRTRCRHR